LGKKELIDWLSTHGLPVEIIIFLFAMLPIFELRGAIPVAEILGVNIAIWKIYLIAVIGNIIPVLPILFLLEPGSNFLSERSKKFSRFFEWLFNRTRRRVEPKIKKYGAVGLIFFVAIPLPVTGAWTGCIAAFLFGIRKRYAFPAILAGVMIAGVVVSIVTYGASSVFRIFLA
jgi:uncharacterized membrane protein